MKKLLVALIATAFTAGAFAQAPKSEPAPAAKTEKKAKTKTKTEKKAAPKKSTDKKAAAPAEKK